MILLSGIAQSLELLTGGAQSTDWTSSYVDITTTTFAPSSNQGNVAAAVATTIIQAPLSSVTRQVKMLSVRNRDGGSPQTVTIQKNVSGTKYRITGDVVLQAGESMQYVDGDGFTIFDSNGQAKLALPPYPLPANPSALVHLTATNGVANTFMRSDAAPALDVTIVPTWTGAHTFLGAVNGANFVNFTDGTQVMGAFTTSGPTQACFGTTSNHSFMLVANARVFLSGAPAGNVSVPAPTSGVAFTATGSGATRALQVNAAASAEVAELDSTAAGGSYATWTNSGTANGFVGSWLGIIGSGSASDFAIRATGQLALATNGTNIRVSITTAGNVTVAAPSSGQTFTVAPSPAAGELIATSSALTTGAGASAGTLTNAPSAGNPTKWIKINDNGTVRSVPAW